MKVRLPWSADLTGNGVTVSNVQTPTITSSTYDASTGSLVVTGTNLVAASGAANDITANKFTLTGEGGATHTLTNTANVEISSGTGFTLTLSATDKAAINQMLNKNGTSTTGGTTYNLAVADDWNTVIGNTSIADTTGNGITTSNVAVPAITSSTYNASTGLLAVTGTGFLKLSGATNDIVANKLTFTGEGGSTYTLTDTANVEITSGTAFSLTLSATDRAAINQIINKNGTSSTGATTYNLAAAEDWAAGAAAGVTDVDASGNGITTSNVAVPAITSSTYDASTGVLAVTGTGFLSLSGATNDVVANKLTFTGEGGSTYTLTDTANVEITSGTAFSLTLSATDRLAINQIINKNGTSSTGATTYNLAAAEDWAAGAAAGVTDVDASGNGITTSNVAVPAITSSTYDASTGVLAVTGTGFLKLSGATNDVVANKLTFTGEGGSTYTLTDTANVEITSGTAFSLTLSATDRAAINQIINKNGTSSTSGTTYNLAAAEDWAAGAAAGVTDVDISGNGITTSNVAVPAITSSTYDAATGVVVVTGSGFLSKSGANNDIDLSKLQFKGEGSTGFQYTLTTASVDVTSSTSFTFTLNAADKAGVNMILGRNGTTSISGTTYLLRANEDWAAGAAAGVTDVDASGNGITTSNVAVPTITSATYNAVTGVLVVTGTDFVIKSGITNDIDVTKLTLSGDSTAYTLTGATSNVEITGPTSFTVTLGAIDRAAVASRLTNNGTSSTGNVTYNLAAAEDWVAGADAAVIVADLTGNGITVAGANAPPVITALSGDSVAWAGVGNTVALDGGMALSVTDTENDATNWNGAILTVSRVTGGSADASANDLFSFSASGFTVSGANLQAAGQTFATFTNTGGTLTSSFANGGADATQVLVQSVMQGILYRNDTPYGDATIRFALSDGNSTTHADVTVTSSMIVVDQSNDDSGNDAADGFSLREALMRGAAQGGADTVSVVLSDNATITLGSAATVGSGDILNLGGANGLSIAGSTLIVGGDLNVTNGSGNTATIGSELAGAGSLSKSGLGTLTLSGANTYTGNTSVTAGTLSIAADGNLGSGAVTLNGGDLAITGSGVTIDNAIALSADSRITNASAVTLAGQISGSSALTKAGAGNLTLDNTNNSGAAATLTVTGGTVKASSDSRMVGGAITLDSGALENGGSTFTMDNAIVLGVGGGTINVNNVSQTLTLSGVISGVGALTKINGGNLTLSGANTYSGGTDIRGANGVSISSGSNLGTGTATLAGGSMLTITGSGVTVSNAIAIAGDATIFNSSAVTLSGVLSGTGALSKAGDGTLTLSGTNTHSGAIDLSAGNLTVIGGASIGDTSAVTVSSGTTLTLGGGGETIGSLTGAGSVALGNYRLTTGVDNTSTIFSGVISGANSGLTKAGSGTLTLTGNNTYTGATIVSAGGLTLNRSGGAVADTTAVTVAAGATLTLSQAEAIGSLAGAGTLALGANTLTAGGNSSSTEFSGVIGGSGGVTKAGSGTLTLSGSSTYSGVTSVSAGTLSVTGVLSATSSLGVSSGATLAGTGTVAGAVTVQVGGTLAPGISGPGRITLGGGLTVAEGGLSMEINGTTAGTDYDQIAVTGAVDINMLGDGSTLAATLGGGYTPISGDSFILIDNDGLDAVSGSFNGLAEGFTATIDGHPVTISYAGSTGNDLVLTRANNAPVLADTLLSLTTMPEDAAAPENGVTLGVGQGATLVSSLVGGVTDGDAHVGIAISAVSAQGTLHYSIDGGATWRAAPVVSEGSALLLADSALIYFQPNADVSGLLTGVISFRAWDQSSGSNGGSADTTINGGTTAFSTATDGADVRVTAGNDAPAGSVTIVGTAAEGETLAVSDTLTDADGLGVITYTWKDGDGDTLGTGVSLVVSPSLIGKTITVTASYTDAQGTPESVMSAATAAVANVNDAPAGSVTIVGTAAEGETLAVSDTLTDTDGLGVITYTWKDGGGNTLGTDVSLVVSRALIGKTITVTASYTDAQGTPESVTSAATAAVANVNDAPAGSVIISGIATQGATLMASDTLADADGLGPVSYQWQVSDAEEGWIAIPGATGAQLQIDSTLVGKALRVVAVYVDGYGTPERVVSEATSVVTGVPLPVQPEVQPKPPAPPESAPAPVSNLPQILAPVAEFLPPASILGLPAGGARDVQAPTPTLSVTTPVPVVERFSARSESSTTVAGGLTQAVLPGGFQVIVAPHLPGTPDALLVGRGMTNQVLGDARQVQIIIPLDAFTHTNPNATVQVGISQVDGQPLPSWVSFDPRTGKIDVQAPPGFEGELFIKVTARDSEGRQAVTTFRIVVGKRDVQSQILQVPAGRAGLSEQLRMASRPLGVSERLAALSRGAQAALRNQA